MFTTVTNEDFEWVECLEAPGCLTAIIPAQLEIYWVHTEEHDHVEWPRIKERGKRDG